MDSAVRMGVVVVIVVMMVVMIGVTMNLKVVMWLPIGLVPLRDGVVGEIESLNAHEREQNEPAWETPLSRHVIHPAPHRNAFSQETHEFHCEISASRIPRKKPLKENDVRGAPLPAATCTRTQE